MSDLHIPSHIDLTRRIAAQQAADVTRLTVEEQQLKAEYDRHQAEYEAERNRVEAELRKRAEEAKQHLDAIDAAGRRLAGAIADVGHRLLQHAEEAKEAQQSVLDWCTRRGISPDDLPPMADTGPLPAIPESRPPVPRDGKGRVVPPPGEIEFVPDSDPGLPAIDDPSGLLAMGQRMADPAATRTDPPAGGEEPAQGDFQGEADRA